MIRPTDVPVALAPLLLITLLTGCMPTCFILGQSEPDLGEIEIDATSRETAADLLGEPLWQLASGEDLVVEIHQFDAERSPDIGMFLMTLGLDLFTLGLTEVLYWDMRKALPVEQVAVTYDREGRVVSVSPTWRVPEDAIGPLRRMRTRLPMDIGIPSVYPGRGPSPDTPLAPATLDLFGCWRASVDGQPLVGRSVEIPAGYHAMEFDFYFAGSVLYGASQAGHTLSTALHFEPGHRYALGSARMYGDAGTRAEALWIEDLGTREVLSCEFVSW